MSSTPSSPRLPAGVNRYTAPLLRPKVETKDLPTDWVKIGAIAAAVIGGLITALAAACIMDYFPTALLGGPLGTGITLILGAAILLPAAMILLDKWQPEYFQCLCGQSMFS